MTAQPSSTYYGFTQSPLARLLLVGSEDGALVALTLAGTNPDAERPPTIDPRWIPDDGRLDDVRKQLDEYFSGARREFDVPTRPQGSEFQRAVWSAMEDIPYGETASYGELARRIGRPQASRAVGAASGQNPVPVVIPCHRVVGSDGRLTGYAWGLDRKTWLLDHEARSNGTDGSVANGRPLPGFERVQLAAQPVERGQ